MEIELTSFEYTSRESASRKIVSLITKDMTLDFTAMKQLEIGVIIEIRAIYFAFLFI